MPSVTIHSLLCSEGERARDEDEDIDMLGVDGVPMNLYVDVDIHNDGDKSIFQSRPKPTPSSLVYCQAAPPRTAARGDPCGRVLLVAADLVHNGRAPHAEAGREESAEVF